MKAKIRLAWHEIQIDQLVDGGYDSDDVLEVARTARILRATPARQAGVRISSQRGPHVLGGGLGAEFLPDNSGQLLIQVLAVNPIEQATRPGGTRIGLSPYMARRVLDGARAVPQIDQLGAGVLRFDRAVLPPTEAAPVLFEWMAGAVVRLLTPAAVGLPDEKLAELLEVDYIPGAEQGTLVLTHLRPSIVRDLAEHGVTAPDADELIAHRRSTAPTGDQPQAVLIVDTPEPASPPEVAPPQHETPPQAASQPDASPQAASQPEPQPQAEVQPQAELQPEPQPQASEEPEATPSEEASSESNPLGALPLSENDMSALAGIVTDRSVRDTSRIPAVRRVVPQPAPEPPPVPEPLPAAPPPAPEPLPAAPPREPEPATASDDPLEGIDFAALVAADTPGEMPAALPLQPAPTGKLPPRKVDIAELIAADAPAAQPDEPIPTGKLPPRNVDIAVLNEADPRPRPPAPSSAHGDWSVYPPPADTTHGDLRYYCAACNTYAAEEIVPYVFKCHRCGATISYRNV